MNLKRLSLASALAILMVPISSASAVDIWGLKAANPGFAVGDDSGLWAGRHLVCR